MNNKLQKLKDKHDLEEYDVKVEEVRTQKLKQAYMFLGAVHNVKNLSNVFTSQYLRGVSAIESENLYLDMGFATFVEFLNSEESPITKSQYYDRIKLLESEGDKFFDLLNEIGVAKATRKLLAAGNYDAIEFTDDGVIVDGKQADLSNLRGIKVLIESYADELKKINLDATKKQKNIETLEGKISELQESLKQKPKTDFDLDAHSTALMNLINAFNILKTEADKLTLVEKEQFAPRTFETIARQMDGLSVAYNRIETSPNEDELADLMD